MAFSFGHSRPAKAIMLVKPILCNASVKPFGIPAVNEVFPEVGAALCKVNRCVFKVCSQGPARLCPEGTLNTPAPRSPPS